MKVPEIRIEGELEPENEQVGTKNKQMNQFAVDTEGGNLALYEVQYIEYT